MYTRKTVHVRVTTGNAGSLLYVYTHMRRIGNTVTLPVTHAAAPATRTDQGRAAREVLAHAQVSYDKSKQITWLGLHRCCYIELFPRAPALLVLLLRVPSHKFRARTPYSVTCTTT